MNKKLIKQCFCIAGGGVLFLIPLIMKNPYWLSVMISIFVFASMSSSLRLMELMGHTSLGHVGFMLLGAYCSSLLVIHTGISFWISLFIAAMSCMVVAFLLGYPFLKVRGIYFVILSLLTAETFRLTASNLDITGGINGLMNIPPLEPIIIGTIVVSFESTSNAYYLMLVLLVVVSLIMYKLEHSEIGFYWKAISNSEELCRSVGINVTLHKMVNFSLASGIAGLTGAFYAQYQQVLSPDFTSAFGILSSVFLLVYVYIGGKDYFLGPFVGTSLMLLVPEFVRISEQYVPLVIGAVAICTVLFLPDGILGGAIKIGKWISLKSTHLKSGTGRER